MWSVILGEAPVKSPCKRPPKPHKSPTAQELEEIRQICREHDEMLKKRDKAKTGRLTEQL